MCVCVLYRLNLELRSHQSETALWLALKQLDNDYLQSIDVSEYDGSFSARLIARGANIDAVDTRSGNSTLHQAVLEGREAAAVFLVHKGALPDTKNNQGETPLHLAATKGLNTLVSVLLDCGVDPNKQTTLKPRPLASHYGNQLATPSSTASLSSYTVQVRVI